MDRRIAGMMTADELVYICVVVGDPVIKREGLGSN
jgi:hypothetical protein